ncbi:MAG TPA: amino acid ABC transporter permease [Chloroflexi bacterium]|nr:amino acid ABC transporter permease [Chloroflexota bacterium]
MRWIKKNLLSTWYNVLLTLVALIFVFFVSRGVLRWVFFTANWTPITSSLKLFAVGQFPPDQVWRVGTAVLLVSFFFGLSWRVWGGTVGTFALALAVGGAAVAVLPFELSSGVRLWGVANPLLVGVGYLVGRTSLGKPRWAALGWALSFGGTTALLTGVRGVSWLPRVETGLWGGLLLTFLLALVGIVASFPIGVLLALGRRSSLPVLKLFCTLFIEIVRGVPLVTILFMFSVILPLFLPEDVRVDRVLRAMMGMTLFAAAYMAENIRGGLQAIPSGQIEAAKAVGLNGLQTTVLIVLPQALRMVIPAIVGQFIALFMDTTLAVIVGLVELLQIGRAVIQSNPEWLMLDMEVYLFIGAVFWVFTYAMSYASQRLEQTLGVGRR